MSEIVIRKDKKYSLTSPFWLVIILARWACVIEVDFGTDFSNQTRSKRFEDSL